MRTLLDIRRTFPAALDNGLTAAEVARSRQLHGANVLTPLPRQPLWQRFIEKFDEPIIKILLAAALLSMLVDLFETGGAYALKGGIVAAIAAAVAVAYLWGWRQWIPAILFAAALVLAIVGPIVTHHPSWDGLAVMVAIILATGVAFLSEYKSDREFEILNAHKGSVRVKVCRAGEIQSMPLEEVVVGDQVVLEMGDELPADGRLVKATELHIDQSLLTGESEPVRKQDRPLDDASEGPDQPGCLYRGTQVVEGIGRLVVTDVGDATYLGQIARRLSSAEGDAGEARRVQRKLTFSRELTPLQEKLGNLAGLISNVGYAAAGAIFLALLIRGLWVREIFWPAEAGDFLKVASKLLDYFLYMVIIIVVAVPEGLPMSVTVSLALAMRKMTRANSLVRQLVACETIGSATVICSDKTGTLTQNKMQVVRLGWLGQVHERGSPGWPRLEAPPAAPPAQSPVDWLVVNAAANSTANLEEKNGKLLPIGNSTEGALLQWLHEGSIAYRELRKQLEPLAQVPFSSERKRMTTVVRQGDRLAALVKGAPEWLLEQSGHYLAGDGSVREWTAEARTEVQQQLHQSAAQAMRTLAFGYAILPDDVPADAAAILDRRETLEQGLVFVGFVAIRDPLRDEVKDALAECRRAGIEVIMITGDNIETARAIGAEIGLLESPDVLVLTSDEFEALTDDELKERLPRLRILARARPLDKYRMVRLLQERSEVVAVTGDGTNDAPALKKADVGLAMGLSGTEVAKEASKIVLLDDSFATIVKAVHWGRALYENIQRFIQFQLTINVSALAIAFLGPFFGVKPPFTILQLLWINVIMDTFASIALCSEPPRSGLMRLPPKRRSDNILTRPMLWNIFTTAAFFVVVMLALLLALEAGWWAGPGQPSPEFPELTDRQVSIFFTVYVFFQVWNEINCRSLVPEISGFRKLWRNPVFLSIVGLIIVGQVLIVTFGGSIFKVEPLDLLDWLAIAAATASVLLFADLTRRLRLALTPSPP